MNNIFKLKRRSVFAWLFFVVFVIGAVVFTLPYVSGASDKLEAPNGIVQEDLYKTTFAKQKESSNLILPGKVLSHESATIFPRRAGIIQDIYLDIGDSVRAGQIIGTLLPEGVEGEGSSLIAEKQARVKQAELNYLNSQKIAEVAIENAKRQLAGKSGEVEAGLGSKITNAQKNIEVAQASLKLSQDALEKKRIDIDNTLEDARSDFIQEKNQIKVIVDSSVNPVDSMLSYIYIQKPPTERIYWNDLPIDLGPSSVRSDFAQSYNEFLKTKQNLDEKSEHSYEELSEYIEISIDLVTKSEDLLRNSTDSQYLSALQISNYISEILSKKNEVLAQQELYEDAFNAYNTALSSTDETLTRLLNQVEKDQKQLEYAVDVLDNITTLAVDNLSLVEVSEQKKIDQAETELAVAQAAVDVEYSKSGHTSIVSPFSGTIAKRHIFVGDMISPSDPLFEVVGVQTALSKISRQEIKFGIDEQYYSTIEIGDEIEFFVPEKETVKYLATITRISPQIDPVTHNIMVQANINTDISLPNNMNVRVAVPNSKTPVFQVPSMLVKEEDGMNYIWVLEDDSHHKLTVDVIAEDGELADVTGELTEETLIITSSPDSFINTEENGE